MTDADTFEGGCLCGQVRWQVTGAPLYAYHCHCRMCQRTSGAAFITGVTFPYDAVAWPAAPPAHFTSSVNAERLFCSRCGSSVGWQWLREKVSLMAGSFDQPDQINVAWHVFTESQQPWVELCDGLTRFKRYPRDIESQDQGL